MGAGMMLASAVAGAISRCVVHPMDTLRARLMVRTAVKASGGDTGHVGVISAARALVAADGLRGLYRGFGISVVMQAPAISVYLSTYERAKPAAADAAGLSERHPAVHLAAALVAEAFSGVIWVPMEVVKQRAQVRAGTTAATSSIAIVRDLLKHEGPRALFKGYGLTLAVFGPYSMIYFVSYERLKEIWAAYYQTSIASLPLSGVAASAACSGAMAAAVTCPLDIIKTRVQTQGDFGARAHRPSDATRRAIAYRSTWHAVKHIAQTEGWRGFQRGVTARLLWIMPGTAITMTTFEHLKRSYVQPPDQ